MPPPNPNPTDPKPFQDAPRIRAPAALRAFREESQLSWVSFNQLWMHISNVLNSPSQDVLLSGDRSHEAVYINKLAELTREVLASGVFAHHVQGRWKYGRYPEEKDKDA